MFKFSKERHVFAAAIAAVVLASAPAHANGEIKQCVDDGVIGCAARGWDLIIDTVIDEASHAYQQHCKDRGGC
jgi:hypothetical protein